MTPLAILMLNSRNARSLNMSHNCIYSDDACQQIKRELTEGSPFIQYLFQLCYFDHLYDEALDLANQNRANHYLLERLRIAHFM